MFRFFETIKLEKGNLCNLSYNQKRVSRTFNEFYPDAEVPLLEHLIQIPEEASNGLFRCRFAYNDKQNGLEFFPYSARKISNLHIREVSSDFNYSSKYEDRSALKSLTDDLANDQDVLIVKDSFITDTSYSNVVFLKDGIWYTPKHYLLAGTKRQYLIDHGMIREKVIKIDDLFQYDEISLINAMLDPGDISLQITMLL